MVARRNILWCELPQQHSDDFTTPIDQEGSIPPGSKYVIAALEAAGHAVNVRTWDEVGPPDGHHVVMVAVMFVRQYPHLPELFRRLQLEPEAARRTGGPALIVGGHGIHNPTPLARLFDLVVLGDAERIAPDLVDDLTAWDYTPHVWPNDTGRAVKRSEPCSALVTRQYGRHTSYLEITRGCRSKCAFCELGWTHAYREAPRQQVLDAIDACERGAHVHLLGPDATSWPYYSEAVERIRARGLVCSYNSMRVDTSERHGTVAASCRLGVEGVSGRLRRLLLKPYPTARIRQRILALNEAGVTTLKLFFLWGLPWTERRDYSELWRWLLRLRLPRGGRIACKFTALIPQPGTPLQEAAVGSLVDEWGYLRGLQAPLAVHGAGGAHDPCTSVHLLPVQTPGRQALETYFTRAGAECWDVLVELERRRPSLVLPHQIAALARSLGVPWSDMMAGRILGTPVEPVRPLPEGPV